MKILFVLLLLRLVFFEPDAIPKVTRENPGAVERGKAIATALSQRAEIEALYPDDMLLNF